MLTKALFYQKKYHNNDEEVLGCAVLLAIVVAVIVCIYLARSGADLNNEKGESRVPYYSELYIIVNEKDELVNFNLMVDAANDDQKTEYYEIVIGTDGYYLSGIERVMNNEKMGNQVIKQTLVKERNLNRSEAINLLSEYSNQIKQLDFQGITRLF